MGKAPEDRKKIFRLTLVENETHRRIRSVKFTRLRFILFAAATVVLILLLAYCAIAFTPLRTTIPGYPDARSKREALRNAIRIDSLEMTINRWNLYAENLSRVLSGEETLSLDSLVQGNTTKYLKNISDEVAGKRDAEMRELVRKEEQFGISDERKAAHMEGFHFFVPLKGIVTEAFDPLMHTGIDIKAPENSVVCATLDGTVIFTGWSDETGYVVQIQHKDNLVSTYKHNQKLLKRSGDKVSAGAPVALAGSYLHFELWHDGEALDPTKYLNIQ